MENIVYFSESIENCLLLKNLNYYIVNFNKDDCKIIMIQNKILILICSLENYIENIQIFINYNDNNLNLMNNSRICSFYNFLTDDVDKNTVVDEEINNLIIEKYEFSPNEENINLIFLKIKKIIHDELSV